MAEKPQEIVGINKVIAELKKLNKASAKDMLREKEAIDRAEKLANSEEVQEEQGSSLLSGTADFQRRFLAGQAKTVADAKMMDEGSRLDEQKMIREANVDAEAHLRKLAEYFVEKKGDDEEEKREDDKEKKEKKKVDPKSRSNLAKVARGAAGMAAIGLGIGGFMSGMMVWSNVDAFKGEGFPDQMKNLTEGWNHIGKLDNKALISLGALAGTGALIGVVAGPLKAAGAAFGMTAIGVGLGGFMTGIMASGSLTGFEGKTFKDQAENLTAGLNYLGAIDDTTKVGLIALAGVGGAMPWKAGTAAVGMGAAGVGIGAFMTGIMASGDITKFDGSTFKTQAQNLADGLNAFTGGQLTGLSVLMATGGILGAIPGGIVLAGTAGTAMGLMGVGIGAFISGIAGAGEVAFKMGATGEGLKTMMENTAGGLKAFNDIDGSNFAEVGAGMGSLGQGLSDFYGTNWLASAGNILPAVWEGLQSTVNAVAGTDFEIDKRTGLEKLLDEVLMPFQKIDFAKWNGINAQGFGDNLTHISRGMIAWSSATPGFWESMGNWATGWFEGDEKPFDDFIYLGEHSTEINSAASAIERLATALPKLTALEFKGDEFKFTKFATDLVKGTEGIGVAMYGGTYNPPGWSLLGMDHITVDKGRGLADIPPLHFDNAGRGVTILQNALNNYDGNSTKSGNAGGTTTVTDASTQYNLFTAPELVDFNTGYAMPGGSGGNAALWMLYNSQN